MSLVLRNLSRLLIVVFLHRRHVLQKSQFSCLVSSGKDANGAYEEMICQSTFEFVYLSMLFLFARTFS